MARYEVLVVGHPRPKGSWTPVYTKSGVKLRPASKKGAQWFKFLHEELKRLWPTKQIAEGPIALELLFKLPRLKSVKRIKPTGRYEGDGDKLERAVLDALTGVAYVDDSQVVTCSWRKQYTEGEPGVHITMSTDV